MAAMASRVQLLPLPLSSSFVASRCGAAKAAVKAAVKAARAARVEGETSRYAAGGGGIFPPPWWVLAVDQRCISQKMSQTYFQVIGQGVLSSNVPQPAVEATCSARLPLLNFANGPLRAEPDKPRRASLASWCSISAFF